MLERLSIKNFKSWRDTGDIRLAPITVFFGANSSGKTSLHQLLLLLKQTAQSTDRQRVLHLGDQRTLVDLGTFSDVVFGHEKGLALEFQLAWRRSTPLKVEDARSKKVYESDRLTFQAEISETSKGPLKVLRMGYDLGTREDGGFSVGMEPHDKQSTKYKLVADGYTTIHQQGRKWPLPAPSHFHGFPDEAVAYFQNTGFVADLTLELDHLLSRIHYVGPLREYPKRLYIWSGEIPEGVGKTGDGAVEALLAAIDRTISPGFKMKRESFQKLVARWLHTMGLIDEFKARSIAEQRKEYEVVVRTRRGAPEVKLTDVGFGVSQVLPVIVECFYVPARSIIIFEQPEIHLHPRVQADLADLFIEAIHAREDRADRSVQLLVESHSEHFLRRLQRRIAEEKITKIACVGAMREITDSGHIVVDDAWRIVGEYQHRLSSTGQPGPGDAFLKWLLTNLCNVARCTQVAITPLEDDPEDFEEFPKALREIGFDRSDRKFVAVALADGQSPVIIQGFDSKWWGWRDALAKAGVTVEFLCEDEIAAKFGEKMGSS